MIKVGIVGGTGYTAGELIRLLLDHPQTEIDFVYSTTKAGKPLYAAHQDLVGVTDMFFTDTVNTHVDVLFLCLGHGNSKAFLEQYHFSENTSVIDLSSDFRLKKDREFRGMNFVYGLPEINKSTYENNHIANPGCFATGIQLALLPLAQHGILKNAIHVNGITGSTGAGSSLSDTSHYSWRSQNVSVYKAFTHQHLEEIKESVQQLQPSFNKPIHFIPIRGNFTRGILINTYTTFYGSIDEAYEIFNECYTGNPFVKVIREVPHLKMVTNTNKCVIGLVKEGDQLLVTSVIDNLLKGASGQAIHNMNILFGLEETAGLKLKANYH